MSKVDEISNMITPLINDSNYRLWSLNITRAAKKSIVTVTLDKDGGANLDELAVISKEIASLIDEHPSFEDAYHLEIESPGLERSLTKPEHYRWSLGMEVSVSFREDQTLSRCRGKLLEVNDEKLVIEETPIESKKSKNVESEVEKKIRNIQISTITKANTVFDFNKAMKSDRESENN